jgi:hypothetical protein
MSAVRVARRVAGRAARSAVRRLAAALGVPLCATDPADLAALAPGRSCADLHALRALCPPGQLSLAEARLLGELVATCPAPRPIIEIGTLFGWSTLVIALFKAPAQPLITVDNYSWNSLGLSPEGHREATERVLGEAIERFAVRRVVSDKTAFFAGYDGPPPALVFCDAVHTYEATRADLEWARRVGAEIICGDDYEPRFEGVMRAVDELGGPRRLVDGFFVL